MNQAVGHHAVRGFFTESEWDLIFNLLNENRMIVDEDHPYLEENYTALDKIRTLFQENVTP